ncbi:Acetyl-CoA synthetase family protein [Paraburkholderia piptadeniae]|uniref:Acetyl-CoA synthetase family protein n=1 Tax=Paraburkholderia piptadeniae TaxID=1701573 RepID=A0A1N7RIK1_9BURK|nr:AMP-binding protein [Paraburkholderia piptadeniae]SIT34939.1 Acetyl-CoA synthetase family protein [Paraburkholderia piptadeniae]
MIDVALAVEHLSAEINAAMPRIEGNYATVSKQFEWRIPEHFNYAVDVIDVWARNPQLLALIAVDADGRERRYTYADVSAITKGLAAGLQKQGVRKGDRVLIVLPRIAEWQLAMIACIRLGAVVIPCIEMLTQKDLAYRIGHSEARAVITTAANVEKLHPVSDALVRISVDAPEHWLDFWRLAKTDDGTLNTPAIAADDPAIMYYTSGSTGMPKGVLHASRALYAWRVSAWYWHGLRPGDVMWCTADTGWSKAGTAILWAPWSTGCTVFFYNGPFDPSKRLELISRYRISVFCAAATEFRHLVAQDLPSFKAPALRLTVSSGEAVNPDVIVQWEKATGCRLLEAYGQTETIMTVANQVGEERRAGAMGRALPGCTLGVLSAERTRRLAGEVGELALRLPNPQLMLGYYKDRDRTAAGSVEVDGERWWLTGDLGRLDEDGFVYYEGRVDDIISSAGYRIGPFEVESALQEHPGVLECAVVASPDPERGEIVKAYVVLKNGVNASALLVTELQDHVKRTTAPYKYPRRIEFVDDLPKTSTGKLLRRLLRDREFGRP